MAYTGNNLPFFDTFGDAGVLAAYKGLEGPAHSPTRISQ